MTFIEFVLSSLGAAIAFSIYKLNIQLRHDSWARTLREVHQYFWTDPYCEEVRAWIANDEAYEKVRPIIKKRQEQKPISEIEYKVLEKIDKFSALLAVYKKIEPTDIGQKDLTNRMFDEYWMGSLTEEKRPELRWYINEFFGELKESLPD